MVQMARHAPADCGKMVESLSSKLGLTIDLASKQWRTSDGRAGTTEPFGEKRSGHQ